MSNGDSAKLAHIATKKVKLFATSPLNLGKRPFAAFQKYAWSGIDQREGNTGDIPWTIVVYRCSKTP